MSQPILIDLKQFNDARGYLRKLDSPEIQSMNIVFKEIYMSESHLGVIRGMHYQKEPKSMWKSVSCISGQIFDVVLDIRKESKSFGQIFSFTLSALKPQALLIPPGFAHGFQALQNGTQLLYQTDQAYTPELDTGYSWQSFLNIWPLANPSLSERDLSLPLFKS